MCAKIKFLIVCLLVPIVALGFVGCNININFGEITEKSRMDKMANTIIEAIQKKDSDAIKQLFSKGVRDNVGDEKLERGVEYLHSIFEGDLISIEGSIGPISTTNENWKTRRILTNKYTVTTTDGMYRLLFDYNITDRITPDFKGIFQLSMRNDSEEYYGVVLDEFMGIYVPQTIDEAEKNIPHEYKTDYGTFTVPAGYYKDDSLSTDDKYYFTIEGIIMSDAKYNHFSIAFVNSDYGLNDSALFRDRVLEDLNDNLHLEREPYNRHYIGDEYKVEEDRSGETAQGYPLQRYLISYNGAPIDKYYYILGEKKYVVVQYTCAIGPITLEPKEEELSMIAAAESLVDSFVWAE